MTTCSLQAVAPDRKPRVEWLGVPGWEASPKKLGSQSRVAGHQAGLILQWSQCWEPQQGPGGSQGDRLSGWGAGEPGLTLPPCPL